MFMLERFFERLLYSSRWLLAPIFMGLALAVLALGVKFFMEVYHIFHSIILMSESDLVLTILNLIDMALVGSLIVMVMFSGYENFVSRIDIDEGDDKLD